jgi:alpha-L-fucosidase
MYGEGPTHVASGSFHDTDTAAYTAEDFRFTTKAGVLYAIEMGWPSSGEAVIHALGNSLGSQNVESVELLGSEAKLKFQQKDDGLHVQVPTKDPGSYAYAFRIRFAGAAQ